MEVCEIVRKRCGFFNGVNVLADGSRGGLSLGWNGNGLVNLQSFSKNHIDVEIQEEENSRWRFTGFYGAPEVRNKSVTWELLRRLGRDNSLSWLVRGDFNDILFAHEKQGGLLREEARMEVFHKIFKACRLEDLGFSGAWFTWERGRTIERNIRERLDRGVANDGWLHQFPRYSLRHLPHSFSNHCPLLIETEDVGMGRQTDRFRFKA
ncbi:hypothetical protein PVK06_005980 [Gossypium arboreum]|uniref:Reverse transcriptase n=1 Tax=Gossypium arboreum TaxID=29729 RepID=A0ABR0QW11_GOSAR|nr:hypothetical protein PVK06_005980 [Gossypium arboreum]